MRHIWVSLGIIGVALATMGMKPPTDEAAKPEFYTVKVKPILETGCYKCHGGEAHRGGLSLATRESILKGGHTGPAIVPGDPAKSLLVTLKARATTQCRCLRLRARSFLMTISPFFRAGSKPAP